MSRELLGPKIYVVFHALFGAEHNAPILNTMLNAVLGLRGSQANVGARGAGVLRWKPNIKWGTDRGKNPPGSPWGEVRDNELQLTRSHKQAARGET